MRSLIEDLQEQIEPPHTFIPDKQEVKETPKQPVLFKEAIKPISMKAEVKQEVIGVTL